MSTFYVSLGQFSKVACGLFLALRCGLLKFIGNPFAQDGCLEGVLAPLDI